MSDYTDELKQLRRDAERYRWLRANAKELVFRRGENNPFCYNPWDDAPEELDAAVDAEIAARRSG